MWLVGTILDSTVPGFQAQQILYLLRVLEQQFSLLGPGCERGVVLQRKTRERYSQTKEWCRGKSQQVSTSMREKSGLTLRANNREW